MDAHERHGRSKGAGRRRQQRWFVGLIVASTLALTVATLSQAGAAAGPGQRGRIEPQIVGGKPVPDGTYPFVVALLDLRRGDTPSDQQFCGGSLIDATHVLTAAHCVATPPPLSSLRVVVGRTVLSSDMGTVRGVTDIAVHPGYRPSRFGNDVAVLTLDQPVAGIAPIARVASGSDRLDRPGTRLLVAGWGNMRRQSPDQHEPDEFPDRMQKVSVPVVGDKSCDKVYEPGASITGKVELCAGKPGVDSCQGDSGGPLFAALPEGGFRQVGVVSWGAGCGARYPGVYAQLSSGTLAKFIDGAIAP